MQNLASVAFGVGQWFAGCGLWMMAARYRGCASAHCHVRDIEPHEPGKVSLSELKFYRFGCITAIRRRAARLSLVAGFCPQSQVSPE
jgi:hypothetical protein